MKQLLLFNKASKFTNIKYSNITTIVLTCYKEFAQFGFYLQLNNLVNVNSSLLNPISLHCHSFAD